MAGVSRALLVVLGLALVSSTFAKVYFEEKFDDGWEKRWVKSSWKEKEGTAGEWIHTAGKWYGDEKADKGIQTSPDARFYAIAAPLAKPLDNAGKDLVLQFSVKHEQKLDCGGGYIKLMPDVEIKDFGGDTDYSIMFGPDICGYTTKKVHAIITYKGKNLLLKPEVTCETDQLTHVYTLVIKPDNTYKILIDNVEKRSGGLYEDWDFLAPRQIADPEAKKPEDWVDEEWIDDPEDTKPEGYDDIPKETVDPDAEKPEDWDDEEDGEWEAPMIPNPEYQGPWSPKKVKNPAYKGVWAAPLIDNPDFEDDKEVYKLPTLKYVGFELWQVKSGSIFDNILVTDDEDYARKFAEKTWGASKDKEKTAFEKIEEEEKKKQEEERKAAEEAAPPEADEAEEPEDEDDEEDFIDLKDEL
ncbi:Calreticulin [Klebsormidium nitens]|uniref:Calreticulin n=1 Tax=Klebsormidium nitens TaxID=105231 RepID=A0A0U9HRK0_KLENI|nr:Calreticulin [Klebsormidium nitens]|eukprot:GAQ81761.1 Calreticulin [Klebsormidium nitens]